MKWGMRNRKKIEIKLRKKWPDEFKRMANQKEKKTKSSELVLRYKYRNKRIKRNTLWTNKMKNEKKIMKRRTVS